MRATREDGPVGAYLASLGVQFSAAFVFPLTSGAPPRSPSPRKGEGGRGERHLALSFGFLFPIATHLVLLRDPVGVETRSLVWPVAACLGLGLSSPPV